MSAWFEESPLFLSLDGYRDQTGRSLLAELGRVDQVPFSMRSAHDLLAYTYDSYVQADEEVERLEDRDERLATMRGNDERPFCPDPEERADGWHSGANSAELDSACVRLDESSWAYLQAESNWAERLSEACKTERGITPSEAATMCLES
jgi:hypothetical protein